MIQKFITLSLLVIGKIRGQEVINPINVQFLPPPIPLNGRAQLILAPQENWQFQAIQAEPLENSSQRAAYINLLLSTTTSAFNLLSTVSAERKNPTQDPERMNQLTTDVPATNTSAGNKSRNDNANDRLNLEEKHPKPVPNSKPPSEVTFINENTSPTTTAATAGETFTLPPIMNVTVVNPANNETVFQPVDKNGTKITLDERANFEGDKCPTGYIKVNGKCVEKD